MAQLAQVLGAVLILAAYAAAQLGVWNQRSRTYLVLNLETDRRCKPERYPKRGRRVVDDEGVRPPRSDRRLGIIPAWAPGKARVY